MVSSARAGRDRLPLPRRGGRRVGAATPGAGTRDVPRGRGRAARRRLRAPRDLFGKRGLPRPSRCCSRHRASTRQRSSGPAMSAFSRSRRVRVWHRGGLFGGLLVLRPRRDALDARGADRRKRLRPALRRRRLLRRLPDACGWRARRGSRSPAPRSSRLRPRGRLREVTGCNWSHVGFRIPEAFPPSHTEEPQARFRRSLRRCRRWGSNPHVPKDTGF